ncbi:hypothetical protein CORC01_10553 [Colletotrichum orchidophilum]|uniref:Uncharacterized protein n=1 Tax=Colletotrichum orchidophilum TaxID=1209926 RepID=A0A1G4AYA0_9PEZI|nr:uncharacterized protein CORC01_10553 [Colletotrichum orchidophilum]OHE94096.1 hypothetical protein CORC01_10553 [Colletotrichum orchidophilum]
MTNKGPTGSGYCIPLLFSCLRLGESDAPSLYCFVLIDPEARQSTQPKKRLFFFSLLFATFCIRIRENSTYPDLLWRLPGQMSLTADYKTAQQQHLGRKPGSYPAYRSTFSLRMPPVPSSVMPEPYEAFS